MYRVWKITAYNSNTMYGANDNEAVVAAYVDWLNRNREINVYSYAEIGEAEAAAKELDLKSLDYVFTPDTTVDDIEAELR